VILREEDEGGGRAMVTSVARRLNRDQVMDISRLSSGKSCMSERESYNRCVR